MPVLFVGHGSPMNAIEDNAWSRGFAALGASLPRPRAVLAVSAHWYVDGTLLTANPRPRTIHDFGGFPDELFAVEYPAPGLPDLAAAVQKLLGSAEVANDWGLDHGSWSVLRKMYPEASVPVVQLSIDRRLSARQHFELARSLRDMRDDGVLILGSGNVTHNLRDALGRMQGGDPTTPDWAARFDRMVAAALPQHDRERLLGALDTPDGRLAHPSPDHWWPLLYAAACADERDAVAFPIEGFDLGSLSMRAVLFGG
ncbi:MAG: 4,5-DOPA dioxygenase extradiol [Planctomycetes bacterium]|nr:4,5-DOPA dioxygenase extradiol [Planctomycetota bacterium]